MSVWTGIRVFAKQAVPYIMSLCLLLFRGHRCQFIVDQADDPEITLAKKDKGEALRHCLT